jgi:hypothetical protein
MRSTCRPASACQPQPLGGRRDVRDDLQVDAVRVHVRQPALTEIAELVVHPLAPRGQRAGAGRRGEFGRPEVLLEGNRSHLSIVPARPAFAALGGTLLAGRRLDGDPDGDAFDAAGVLGGTEDQGVGAGSDPERFGDLVEQ